MTSEGATLREVKEAGRKKGIKKAYHPKIPDIFEKAASSKLEKKLKTGLVTDDKFKVHACSWDPLYAENPERYQCVIDRIRYYELMERCIQIESRLANRDEILLCHDGDQIDLLESTSHLDSDEMENLASLFDSIYFNLGTYAQARLAAGSSIELVKAILNNKCQNGMAIVRPPGHHATKDQYSGYCFFNNVAIAAKYALETGKVQKVLIVDWDVHHGNGTQQIFYDDPNVLYFSIHRFEYGKFWPNQKQSNYNYIGGNAARGKNINIPLNITQCSDADYLSIFQCILIPVAYEFQPDLILISAGYDAAIGCPEGDMIVSPGCYHHLTTMLLGLAGGKVAVILEGGYFLPSLAESAAQTLRALIGDPAPRLEMSYLPLDSVMSSIYDSLSILRDEWECLAYTHDRHIGEPDNRYKHKPIVQYEGVELKGPYQTRYCYPVHTTQREQFFKDEVTRLQNCYYDEHPVNIVGYVYDSLMTRHRSPVQNQYERPERVTKTIEILKEMKLFSRLHLQPSRCATYLELTTCHGLQYINKINHLTPHTEAELHAIEGWSTVFSNESTMTSASMAAGNLIELVTSVLAGQCSSGIGIIRPPGHHAEPSAAGGFCFFNSAAIAARFALNQGLKRILIVDFDIHHGNGIQEIFYETARVLYISLHRYDHGRFYPQGTDGDFTEIGRDDGLGFNINVPFNQSPMTDADYIAVFTRIVLPVAYQYNPELVIVAAGFDACKGDPLGGYHLTPEAFGHFVQLLKPLAAGRIVLALEGGYNVNSIGYAMSMCVKALLGDPLPPLEPCGRPHPLTIVTINRCIEMLRDRWFMMIKDVQFVFENKIIMNEFIVDSSSASTSTAEPEIEIPQHQ